MRLTRRRLPTFLNSNFFVPRRMFSTCSGLIDNKSFNVHITPFHNAHEFGSRVRGLVGMPRVPIAVVTQPSPVHVVAESEVAQVDHLDHHQIPLATVPGRELVFAEYRLVLDAAHEVLERHKLSS